ncbi:MAG: phosphoenolpyruvate carboxykinase domain-containing protein, partial [Promethearchaeota archaeon]
IRAVNVERGIFGIIRAVTQKDDPVIWDVLHSSHPAIFSNVLVTEDAMPRWLDDDCSIPEGGINHSGDWFRGKVDRNGEEIPFAHKNARYTIGLDGLSNLDDALDDARGVEVGGIIYGGRDRNTWVPVHESLDWAHGVILMGASLESETTAATLGPSGVRKFQPFSNLDFISIPLGKYIQNHLDFAKALESPPTIFAVNYFQQDNDGNFLTDKLDKTVWLKWMELRVHNEVEALLTPIGYIPKYGDLKNLFFRNLDKDYSIDEYNNQFTIRIPELLSKADRVETFYKENIDDTPEIFFKFVKEQRGRLQDAQAEMGDCIVPTAFENS